MQSFNRYVLFSLVLASVPPAGVHAAAGSGENAVSAPPASVMLWRQNDAGERLFLRGRVLDPDGHPLPGARVFLRQADGNGRYHDVRYRAALETSTDGTFSVSTVLPGQYWGPRHIHLRVAHQGYGQLATRVLFKGDPYLDEARAGDFAILLEEVHDGGERMLVGDVELVLPAKVGN